MNGRLNREPGGINAGADWTGQCITCHVVRMLLPPVDRSFLTGCIQGNGGGQLRGVRLPSAPRKKTGWAT